MKYWDPGVFRASPRPPIARRPSTPALTAVQRQVSGVRACSPWPLDLPALPGFVRSSTRPTGVGRCSAGPRLLRFRVPLAASLLRSGLPGITTPGTFRPWSFSNLRRFTPPDNSPVLFRTGTTSGIQRTRLDVAFLVFLTGPSKGQSRPGLRASDTITTSKDDDQGIVVVSCSARGSNQMLVSNLMLAFRPPDFLQAVRQERGTSTSS